MRRLLVLLLLAGCGSPSAPLSATLEQSRDNENRHLLQVVLTNDGDHPLDTARIQLRSPLYSGVPPTVRDQRLEPGQSIAFPVGYGVADCTATGATDVVVGLRAGAALQDVPLRVPASDPLLPRLFARECTLARLDRAASVGFGSDWRRVGREVVGALEVTRRSGSAPVTVTSASGSVIFTLLPGPLPVTMGGSTPVRVSPSRCDPHALIESKRTYDYNLTVTFEGRPLTLTRRPDPAGVALLAQLLQDVCAF